jgi:predicted component of type VI protein secretion system
MADHIVARALRAQADKIAEELASPEMSHGARQFLSRIRAQFIELAGEIHAIERQPLAGLDLPPVGLFRKPLRVNPEEPLITISASRVEKAARAAYNRMGSASIWAKEWTAGRPVPVAWEHLDERDRQLWRDAAKDALRAALEADNG